MMSINMMYYAINPYWISMYPVVFRSYLYSAIPDRNTFDRLMRLLICKEGTTSEMKFNRIEFDSEVTTECSEGVKCQGFRLKTLLVYNEMKFI